jgi:hypothetical protein
MAGVKRAGVDRLVGDHAVERVKQDRLLAIPQGADTCARE